MKQKKSFLVILVALVSVALIITAYTVSLNDSGEQEVATTSLSANQVKELDYPEDLSVGGFDYRLIDSSVGGTGRWANYELADGPSATLNVFKWKNTENRISFPDKERLLDSNNAVSTYIEEKLDTAGIDNAEVISAEFNKLDTSTDLYELRYSYSVENTDGQKMYWNYVIEYDYAESFVREFSILLDTQTTDAFNELDQANEALSSVL